MDTNALNTPESETTKPLRVPKGWYLKGHGKPGPGAPKRTRIEEADVAIQRAAAVMAPALAAEVDALVMARKNAPAVMGRLVAIALDENTPKPVALDAAKQVLDRAHGLPTAMTVNLNADITPEQTERGQAALEKLRQLMAGTAQQLQRQRLIDHE